jgi:hypothetical protein
VSRSYESLNGYGMNRKITFLLSLFCLSLLPIFVTGQGLNIPSDHVGISFGNSTTFSGLRFNFIDRKIERINGVNFTVWHPSDEEEITGSIHGLSVGLPMAYGSAYRTGISLAIFGVGAHKNVSGINIGGLAVGAGERLSGINIGGLAVGAGGRVSGINVGGLAVGASGRVTGINLGGLAVGSGSEVMGINIAGLAVGSGVNLSGINIGGLVAGSGGDMRGLNFGGLVVGSGDDLSGISIGGLAVGAGGHMRGLNIAGLAAGAVHMEGLTIAPLAGGAYVTGITVAPLYFTVRYDAQDMGYMKGLAVSSFNHVKGQQRGLTIGILNIAHQLDGVQIGLINIAKSNRKGLKVLPIFNAPFR